MSFEVSPLEDFTPMGFIDAILRIFYTYFKMFLHLPVVIFQFYMTGLGLILSLFKYHVFSLPARPLHNEIALVIGSDTILGRSFSTQVVKMKGTVICVDSDKEKGEVFVKSLNDANPGGPKAFFYQCDVTHREQVVQVVDTVTKDVGDVTILINCMESNLVATYFQVFKIILPIMKGNGKGSLVFIRSADYESRNAIKTLQESITRELKESKTEKIQTVVANVFPKVAVTSDTTGLFGMFGVVKPENVAKSVLEGVAKNRKEIYLPGYMIYCIFWVKLLPNIISNSFDDLLFTHEKKKVAA